MGISLEGSISIAPIKEIDRGFKKSLILADDPQKKIPSPGVEPAVFATTRETGRPTFCPPPHPPTPIESCAKMMYMNS